MMKNLPQWKTGTSRFLLLLLLIHLFAHSLPIVSPPVLSEPLIEKSDPLVYRNSVNLKLFSIIEGSESYLFHGSLFSETDGLVILSCQHSAVVLQLESVVETEEGRFQISVVAEKTVAANESDQSGGSTEPTSTVTEKKEFDLADLKPVEWELHVDTATGRRFVLQILPEVRISGPDLKSIDGMNSQAEQFYLAESPVILNDDRYLGKITLSGGEILILKIPHVGIMECSLVPFGDAEIKGTLDDGVMHLETFYGVTVDVYDVCTMLTRQPLEGGPYQVWVLLDFTGSDHDEVIAEQVSEFFSREPIPDAVDTHARLAYKLRLRRIEQGYMLTTGMRNISQTERQ